MATRYANIDVSASPAHLSGIGSSSSPFNYGNLVNYLNCLSGSPITTAGTLGYATSGDIIKIRGNYDVPQEITFIPTTRQTFSATNLTFEPWDLNSYGYWKIKSDYSTVNLAPIFQDDAFVLNDRYLIFDGMVIENANLGMNTAALNVYDNLFHYKFKNSIFIGNTNYRNIVSAADEFDGCTFTDGTFVLSDSVYYELSATNQSFLNFNDCVFENELMQMTDTQTSAFDDTIVFNNCVFDDTSAAIFTVTTSSDSVSFNSCTFSWPKLRSIPNYNDITLANKAELSYLDYGLEYDLTRRRYWLSGDYNDGITYYRKGPGAFYWNDDIYVALDAVGTGTGTPTSAMNYAQWYNYTNAYDSTISAYSQVTSGMYDGDNFQLSGMVSATTWKFGEGYTNPFLGTFSITNWRDDPWKIYSSTGAVLIFDGFFLPNRILNMSNGILDTNNNTIAYWGQAAINNMFIKCNRIVNIKNATWTGSTIITDPNQGINVLANGSTPYNQSFTSCVVIGPIRHNGFGSSSPPPHAAQFYNCVFDSVDGAALSAGTYPLDVVTVSDSQYGWTMPYAPTPFNPLSYFTYTNLGVGITATKNSSTVIPGLWNTTRTGVGAFYFDTSVTVQPEPFQLILNLQDPTIYSYKDIVVDFIGIPRAGNSPLVVDFSASCDILESANVSATDFNWYFDYDNYPSEYVTCANNTAVHEYSGYPGRKYSVKCLVNLGVKS